MAKLSLWMFIIAAAGLSVAQENAPKADKPGDLKILESQIESGEMDKAKVTLSRLRVEGSALPESASCEDLDKAVSSGDKDKALQELRKFKTQCQDCDPAPSEKKK